MKKLINNIFIIYIAYNFFINLTQPYGLCIVEGVYYDYKTCKKHIKKRGKFKNFPL